MTKNTKRQTQEYRNIQREIEMFRVLESLHYRQDFDNFFLAYLKKNYPTDYPQSLRNDADIRDEFFWSEEGRALAERWNLLQVYDPKERTLAERQNLLQGNEPDGDDPPFPATNQPGKFIARQDKPIGLEEIRQHDIHLNPSPTGRYLAIEIDLHQPKDEIMVWVSRLLKQYRHRVDPKPAKKVRGIEIERLPIHVYYEHEGGKSLLQITHELFPKLGGANPNYDKNAARRYKEVLRAHQKALEILANLPE